MASKKENTRAPDLSTDVNPKAYYDQGSVFTVDFTNNGEKSWTYLTEWTCIPKSGQCEIILTRRIYEHLCNMMRLLDRPPSLKLASLRNPDQKVILVFGHDTKANAFNMFKKFTDVRNTVLSFLQKVKIPVEDIKVRVRLTGTSQLEKQHDRGYDCIFDSTADYSEQDRSETTWFCIPDTLNLEVDNETSNSHFTRFKENITHSFEACLGSVATGSVIFTFHHRSTEDALDMISKHKEVRAMILECLQGIDSTVTDIQVEVQLQDFIDQNSLSGHGVLDKRFVDKQEHDKVVKDLSEQVATLEQQLQEMKEMEQAQLPDTRMSMWNTRPGSPKPSESTGYYTITEVGDEEFPDTTDLSEPGDGHRKKGDSSKAQHMSEAVTDLRRQLAATRQELKATTERMHRLEIAQRKETPTPARRDARADADLRVACVEGNLEEVKRILDTGLADVNSRGERGRQGDLSWTPVMYAVIAARWSRRDVVEFLVSRGADVSLLDDDGDNILHLACAGGDRETVEFVLSLDVVDVDARNNDGETAADVARRLGRREVSNLLVSRDMMK